MRRSSGLQGSAGCADAKKKGREFDGSNSQPESKSPRPIATSGVAARLARIGRALALAVVDPGQRGKVGPSAGMATGGSFAIIGCGTDLSKSDRTNRSTSATGIMQQFCSQFRQPLCGFESASSEPIREMLLVG